MDLRGAMGFCPPSNRKSLRVDPSTVLAADAARLLRMTFRGSQLTPIGRGFAKIDTLLRGRPGAAAAPSLPHLASPATERDSDRQAGPFVSAPSEARAGVSRFGDRIWAVHGGRNAGVVSRNCADAEQDSTGADSAGAHQPRATPHKR